MRVLWLDRKGKRLYIDHQKRFHSKGTEKGLDIADVSEVRPGINSIVFRYEPVRPSLSSTV
jgi:hypothetical protein